MTVIFLLTFAIASVSAAYRSFDDDWTRYDENPRSGDSAAKQVQDPSYAQLRRYLFARPTVYDAHGENAGGLPGLRKRNNGAWVWMPAQGYVSLPKTQQTADAGAGGKNGKVMRYGK